MRLKKYIYHNQLVILDYHEADTLFVTIQEDKNHG